ncbi:MAG TPA: tetratricopeptide repeat protein [Candidatus Acidoferrales bacterium]|jgi:protein O-GlcNAc transferase|nr:tetratricopeptide repeat protein [Candidatus Acidoferrales bacterium]
MNPAALLEQGLAAHRAGQLEQAGAVYRQMLERWPKHPDALFLLGLVVQNGGNHAEAIGLFARAAKAEPRLAKAHLQRGFSLNALGRQEDAAAAFKAAIAGQLTLAEAHHQLGNTRRTLNRLPEALASLREATRLAPADTVFWLSRGMACMDDRQFAEAVESFQQAVKLDGSLPEAREILGQALMALQRNDEAREQLKEALRLRPDFAEAHHDLGRICLEEGLLAEAVGHYRNALAVKRSPDTHTNLLFLLNYLPETTPEKHFAEHRRWSEWFEQPLQNTRQPHANDATPGRRLRIGYVSPDLRDHPVASFFEPVLKQHNRENFEVFCYSTAKASDAVTQRLRGPASQWRDIHGVHPDKVAELIRQDGIDILVDLAGHTTDNGLLVFARKPAPVQVTWIGYPNTTGLEAVDYRLTDAITDPPGQTEQWHSERLLRLPETFSCYCAPAESPAAGALPALANGHVTFGSLNNFRKLSEPTVELWARLLREMPTARLLLKSQGLNNPKTAGRLRDQFVRAGVAPERVELLGAGLTKEQHMGLYNRVDIGLDPFPYNGTTTTCDALWMGVPVVTLAGRTHVARVGLSLVSHLGFPEWGVETADAYVAKCRELAGDLAGLAQVRSGLREQMRQSPLCDAVRFIGHLESAYGWMWERWRAEKK